MASAKSFIKENVDVAAKFFGKFWPAREFKSKEYLENGEGGIFKMDGKTLAIYRDSSERLLVVDPTCTHMKCQVNWNEFEKSWDCPCHGARYSVEGEVLTGPADANLTKVEAVPLPAKAET